jgi:integrase
VAKLLEALEPQGDIHPPQFDSILKQVFDQFENSGIVVETKLKEQMANDAKTVAASFESPTALGESAARQTLADLLGFGSAPDELKEWTSSLPKPADYAALKQAERTWYGMDDVRRGLGLKPKTAKPEGNSNDKRGRYGDGSITQRGENSFRLRYRIGKQRFAKTFHGTHAEAKKELRALLRSGDTGEHVEPTRMTVGEWIEHWLSIGAPGRKKKRAGRRSVERYEQLMRGHVIPELGAKKLQQLHPTDIDRLYQSIEGKLASKTQHNVHAVLSACLNAAVRKGLLLVSPVERAERIPSPGESNHGQVLDQEQLAALVQSFRGFALYPIVAVAAFTGARRNEILALQWSDLDPVAKTLRIERAMEESKDGRGLKGPKRESHKRTIQIDDALVRLLLSVREQHLRLVAGVPDAAQVDLSLIKLPEGALMFPSPHDDNIDLTKLRNARRVTETFKKRARKVHPGLRFHDLRGSHETALLDAGVPVHVVAARCGHDPATLLRSYAKRTRKADTSAADVIAGMSRAILD